MVIPDYSYGCANTKYLVLYVRCASSYTYTLYGCVSGNLCIIYFAGNKYKMQLAYRRVGTYSIKAAYCTMYRYTSTQNVFTTLYGARVLLERCNYTFFFYDQRKR